MALTPGSHLESCEILELLGSGGMGEVYRGRDTKLGREVAVKALPDIFSNNPERLGRFEREAQVLAALNHPNIAVIHELKEVGGARYLILELVEGETLAQVVARGPVPIDEAVGFARQIAEALEAAHDRGIVHRDLKPANVKITPEGRVKVLDFGLAKIHESSNTPQALSRSPTLSALNTATGVMLGTAAYMSPEQVRGRGVDRRADVWAFGCVLYEMLAGKKTFAQGETVSDTLANILAREPDWQALPAETPPRIRALLERCLRKDPSRRLQDVGNARVELEEAQNEADASVTAPAVSRPSKRRERILAAAAAVFCVLTTGLAASLVFAPVADSPMRRFEATLPNNLALESGMVLSPDGLKVAFVTSQPAQIWVRRFEAAMADPIPSTEGVTGTSIFWSPDSQEIGFFADGRLKKVAATGGPAQVLSTVPGGGSYSGSWGAGGVILVASDAVPGGPLLRVSTGSAGEAQPATALDKSAKEISHRLPHFLPDGRHYVFLATGADARERVAYVGDLESKERIRLPGVAAEAKYSSSGHLVFIRDGALMAQVFDPKRFTLSGAPFSVADPFAPPTAVTYPFSVSMTGVLAFRTNAAGGGGVGGGNSVLVWYDKGGARLEPAGTEAEFRGPELSPDGKYVVFGRGAPSDIWVLDIGNARTDRLTSHPADDLNPRWSPDGTRVAFDSVRDGVANLYMRTVGVVAADDTLVLKTESAKTLSDWTRNDKYLVYTQDNDIWALPLMPAVKGSGGNGGDAKQDAPKPIRVTQTPFIELTPRVSPDGRWVAYASNEPGEYRIYIQSFPEPGIKQPVSTGGGLTPRWSHDGKELFFYTGNQFPYSNPSGAVWAASVDMLGSSLRVGAPAQRAPRGIPGTTSYSVTSDRRFLLQTALAGGGRGLGGRPVGTNREQPVTTYMLNWAHVSR